jgi:hypothetical protein
MQGLASASDKTLAGAEWGVGVTLKRLGKLGEGLALVLRQAVRRLMQLPAGEGAEALATTLQILESALGLQLKALLQWA